MAMGKHPAICSAEAGLKIKMYGCAIWPGHDQCQLSAFGGQVSVTGIYHTIPYHANFVVSPRKIKL